MISVLIIFLLCVEVSFNQCSNRTQDYIQENCFTSQINPKTNQEVMNVGSYSVESKCGNWIKTDTEECDDGNTDNGDGCNSTCKVETGWQCFKYFSSNYSFCSEICGDGVKYNTLAEYCDDRNTADGDGCNSTCQVENGWTCTGGSSSSKDTCSEICGDGRRFHFGSSDCDDENRDNGDGCSSNCSIETGWTCSGGSPTSKDTCKAICGDGMRFNLNSGFCDDGNNVSGDGCSSSCKTETGWICTGGSSSSKDTCSEICGDGGRFHFGSSDCDDENIKNGDGCSSTCSIETGWTCSGGSPASKDTCNEICGDGMRFNSDSNYCDDGNNVSGDGCDSTCYTEVGWTCIGGSSSTKDTCSEICGDGTRFHSYNTYCDDGNTNNKDGCTSSCSIEAGWTCSGGSSTSKDTCKEICGDGIRFNSDSSYCDDSNTSSGDGCTSSCSVESGWTCKGDSNNSADICNEICGDGIRFNTNSSYCDDGNTNDDDGCSSSCNIESNWKCSGGNSTHVDKCVETLDQSISEMGQAVAGAAGGVAVVFSLCNISTPTGLWITMNQFQLIMLLLLTNSSIPLSIVAYLSGLKTTTCSFNFLPFKNIPIISKAVHYFDFDLSNEELSYFGINSGSSFVNNFSLICIVLILILIHILLLLVNCLCKSNMRSREKLAKCMGITTQYFAFSLYIRVMYEVNVFMLLSSFSELSGGNTSNPSRIYSLIISFIFAWICICFISLSLINWIKSNDNKNKENCIRLKEFFSGIKDEKYSRLYPTLMLIRRLIFVAWLILGKSFSSIILICPMIVMQVAYLANLVFVKPYKLVKDNIIEITNECFYCLLVGLLSYFNSKERWNSVSEDIYFGIILGNSISIISIMISSLAISSILKLRQKCKKKIQPTVDLVEIIKHQKVIVKNKNNINDFSSLRISNIGSQFPTPRDNHSDIGFYEEAKQKRAIDNEKLSQNLTPNEYYWQTYNPIDGGKKIIKDIN